MTTSTRIAPALLTALLAAAAVVPTPAAAQQVSAGALGAIAHFNGDHDSQDDRVILAPSRAGVVAGGLSTRSGGFNAAQARFNRDFDGQSDVRRTDGGTVVSGRASGRAGALFARIARESAENE